MQRVSYHSAYQQNDYYRLVDEKTQRQEEAKKRGAAEPPCVLSERLTQTQAKGVSLITFACLQVIARIKAQVVAFIQRSTDSHASHIFYRRRAFGAKAGFTDGICRVRRTAAHLMLVVLVDPGDLYERGEVAESCGNGFFRSEEHTSELQSREN